MKRPVQNSYFLEPGYIYLTSGPVTLLSVLGSCVAVCLWDGRLKCGGMNHFLYPSTSDASRATAKYGNVAMAWLVQMMDDAGCRRADLKAQIYGGGYLETNGDRGVGEENVRVARMVLARKGITVVSEDVGGTMGRKIMCDVGTGHVAVLKVHKLRDTDWLSEWGP